MQTSITSENVEAVQPDLDRQLYRYWMTWIKRAKKLQPSKDWIDAEKALKGEESDLSSAYAVNSSDKNGLPYVNGYRGQYEALKSFLDQTEADFRVSPSDAFMGDPVSIQQAEADYAYLKYIWRDQKCQIAQSKKLDSTLRRNVGYTMPFFDKKKWMPCVKYIPARNVILDPDCDGDLDKASALAYIEYISIEELKSKNPQLTPEELDQVSKKALTSLDKDELEQLNREFPEDNQLYTVVALYHIFARNEAAVRVLKDGEPDLPDDSIVTELNLSTPRRYLQFVEGLDRPIKDQNFWDFDLDDNEWPITKLSFNTPAEDLYGYTDYSQMKRIDKMCNNIFYDIERNSYHVGNKKFGGTAEAGTLTKEGIEGFLNDPKSTYHPDIIGSDGKAKVVQIDTGKYEPALIQAYTIADEARKQASALGELLSTEVEQWKDVTAIATRIHDANVHQRVNRRLNGPEGYEQSITEDAIKLLEIAHQFVPKYSAVEVQTPMGLEQATLPWQQAVLALRNGGRLVMLGADAIIGPKLAEFWRTTDEVPTRIFKLSTNIAVMPGSTRSITKEQKAILMKQYYLECYAPFYQLINRPDLANEFLSRIGHLAGIDGIDDLLPETLEAKQFMEEQKQDMAEQKDLMDEQQQIEVIKAQADIESKLQKEENGAGNGKKPVQQSEG